MELIKVSTTPSTSATQAPLTPLFMSFCEELSYIANSYGIYLKPYNENGINRFASLTLEQQTGIVEALRTYVLQLHSAIEEKIEPRGGDNRRHAWWSLNKLGLRPPMDLFDQITDRDIIEIYNQDSIQVFRSFDMFQYLSYSLSEIFSFDWTELYDRDDFVFNRMFNLVGTILQGTVTGISAPGFPPHVVVEKFSENKRWAKMQHSIFCPLYNIDGSIGGFLSTFKILDSGSN